MGNCKEQNTKGKKKQTNLRRPKINEEIDYVNGLEDSVLLQCEVPPVYFIDSLTFQSNFQQAYL